MGSNPIASAPYRRIAQPGSARALGAWGREFKSFYADHITQSNIKLILNNIFYNIVDSFSVLKRYVIYPVRENIL